MKKFVIELENGLIVGPIVRGIAAGWGTGELYYIEAPVQLWDCRAVRGVASVWTLAGNHINGGPRFAIKRYLNLDDVTGTWKTFGEPAIIPPGIPEGKKPGVQGHIDFVAEKGQP